jgi:glycosyltransferase involved in cell wall biosynthesis
MRPADLAGRIPAGEDPATGDDSTADAPPGPLRLAILGDPSSVHVRRFAGYFARRGHRVHLLLNDRQPAPTGLDPRIEVGRFRSFGRRFGGPGTLAARRSLRRELGRIRPDVVHAHYLSRHGWAAALAGRHPYVITVWGSDVLLELSDSLAARLLARWALGNADLVTGVSDNLLRAAVAAGAHAERCKVIQFGVDGTRFTPGPAPEELRRRLGLGGRRVVFGPRVLEPLYRHEVELEALASLPGDVALIWSELHPAAGIVDALRARAAELGVLDRLVIVPEIEHDAMPDFYRLADVVVSVPESDAFAVSLLEAMACGTPLVVSRLPATEEAWGDLPAEWLVPVGDGRATAAALRRALELAPAERADLGARLRTAALARGEEAGSLAAMEAAYRDLVRRSARSG